MTVSIDMLSLLYVGSIVVVALSTFILMWIVPIEPPIGGS